MIKPDLVLSQLQEYEKKFSGSNKVRTTITVKIIQIHDLFSGLPTLHESTANLHLFAGIPRPGSRQFSYGYSAHSIQLDDTPCSDQGEKPHRQEREEEG
jgi:hypothetical protein